VTWPPNSSTSIDDEDLLFRRLAPHQINKDGSVNSSAFKRSGAYASESSVDLAKLTDAQTSVDRVGRAGFRLGAMRAGHPRSLGFAVEHDPLPDNDAHTLIIGRNDQERSRALARGMELLPGIVSRDSPPT
jgi:hypothetical protein